METQHFDILIQTPRPQVWATMLQSLKTVCETPT